MNDSSLSPQARTERSTPLSVGIPSWFANSPDCEVLTGKKYPMKPSSARSAKSRHKLHELTRTKDPGFQRNSRRLVISVFACSAYLAILEFRGHPRGSDIGWKLHPIPFHVGPRLPVHSDLTNLLLFRRPETQTNAAGKIAFGRFELAGDAVLAPCIYNRHWTEVSAGILESALLARPQPPPWDCLSEEQLIVFFPDKDLTQPAARIRLVGALKMIAAPIAHLREGVFGVHVHIG